MAFTKEQIEPFLNPDNKPRIAPLVRGSRYMLREVPDEYFVVQDWCISQGFTDPQTKVPDLSHTFQGLEYIFQTATGKEPNEIVLSKSELVGLMHYLNRPADFEGGALRQYPEYQRLIREQLLKMPNGIATIEAIQRIDGFEDLFRE